MTATAVRDQLKAELKAYAAALGVTALGVTTAEPFEAEAGILRERRRAGLTSRFEPETPTARRDPRELLPGARSIVAVGVAYHARPSRLRGPEAGGSGSPLRGWLSRYAWGEDYHRVLHRILARLIVFLEARASRSLRAVAWVDTGPLIERAVARRAGLGWIGKHGCLIVPGAGSYVFLGEIVTDLELKPDRPVPDGCGSCNRCTEACPTRAIVFPGVVDARRCLAEVSQWRQPVPEALRRPMARRLFGCDTCQEVCPYNRHAPETVLAEFLTPPAPPRPDLAELLRLDGSGFRTRWARSAAGWRGKKVLQRNAVIALGNSGDPAALPLLLACLDDRRPQIRGHAAWALARLAGVPGVDAGQVRRALGRALEVERERWARAEILMALDRLPRPAGPGDGD